MDVHGSGGEIHGGGAVLRSAATGAVEGFAIVLCDLKTLLETGQSAGLVRAKAELISAAQAAKAS